MTYHPISAVSVASIVTATTVIIIGYRAGRAHAAWKDLREAKRAVHHTRRHAWAHSARLAGGVLVVLAAVAAGAYDLTH